MRTFLTALLFSAILLLAFPHVSVTQAAGLTKRVAQSNNIPPIAIEQTIFVMEDASTDLTLTGSDPDGDPLTYHVLIPPEHGRLGGIAPHLFYTPTVDYSGIDSFAFKVNDGQVDSVAARFYLSVQPINDPPTNILLSQRTISENLPAGSIVGTFGTVDADPADRHSYLLSGGDLDVFALDGSTLKVLKPFDYEQQNRYAIAVTSSDGRGGFLTKLIAIEVIDINEPRPEPVVGCAIAPLDTNELCRDLADQSVVTLTPGQYLTIKLPVQPSIGYLWYWVAGYSGSDGTGEPIVRPLARANFHLPNQNNETGQVATEIYRLDPVAAGQATLKLEYRNGNGTILNSYSLQVAAVGLFNNVQPPALTPLDESLPPTFDPNQVPPHPLASLANSLSNRLQAGSPTQSSALPTSFSWCKHPDGKDYCTPIRDQRTCGSCWAFTTAAVMESQIRIKDGVERDLAEQYLVSCNSQNYSCNGGWYAFDYYKSRLSKLSTGPGAVWETDFAYGNSNLTCKAEVTHHETAVSWGYVTPDSPRSVPDVNAIKQALYDHGPLATAVCVSDAFLSYKSGIFQTNESSACGNKSVNHAVVLVGWNDVEGVWILRNSWNTWWGEKGYMRILYGTSNVGYGASYVIYEGTGSGGDSASLPNTPLDLVAVAQNSLSQVHLAWQDASDDETGFKLFRRTTGDWKQIASLATNLTAYVDVTAPCGNQYTYALKATNSKGDSANYSNSAEVLVSCPGLLPPTELTATTSSTGVALTWKVTNNDQDGSSVVRWNQSTKTWDEMGTVSGLTDQYTDTTGLLSGQTYYYAVRASKGSNHSPYSQQAEALAPFITLAGPTTASAQRVVSGTIQLQWQDQSNEEEGFVIARYDALLDRWKEVASVGANTTTFTDRGLPCSFQPYRYLVAARKGIVQSSYSNMASSVAWVEGECTAAPSVYLPMMAR